MYYIGAVGFGYSEPYLAHHGIKGQKHGIRRFQNEDGTLTPAGRERYLKGVAYKQQERNKMEAYQDARISRLQEKQSKAQSKGRTGKAEKLGRKIEYEKRLKELEGKKIDEIDELEGVNADRAKRAGKFVARQLVRFGPAAIGSALIWNQARHADRDGLDDLRGELSTENTLAKSNAKYAVDYQNEAWKHPNDREWYSKEAQYWEDRSAHHTRRVQFLSNRLDTASKAIKVAGVTAGAVANPILLKAGDYAARNIRGLQGTTRTTRAERRQLKEDVGLRKKKIPSKR